MSSDGDLMRRVTAGDARAFEALFERYEAQVRSRLRRIVWDEAAVEDLLQEVFLRLWTKADQWKGQGALVGWLLRTATNLALNYLRSLKRRPSRPLEFQVESEDESGSVVPRWMIDVSARRPDEIAQMAEEREALWALVDALPEEQRRVLRMVHEAEMKIGEVADELGISSGTVKSRLHYARGKLAKEWSKLIEEREDT